MESVKIKEIKKSKTEDNANMGFGGHPASSPNTVFPRSFRWTLNSEKDYDIHWWMKSLKTDFVNKAIIIDVYDDAQGVVFDWLQAIINEGSKKLTLTHFDGCGTAITKINFIGLKLDSHITDYDYSKSEVLTHKVVILYKKIERLNKLNIQ